MSKKLDIIRTVGKNGIYEKDWVFDKQILLFKRRFDGKESPIWHAKIRVTSAKGHLKFSTKTRSKDEAQRIAVIRLREAEGRAQQGYSLRQVRFEEVATKYGEWLKTQFESGKCTKPTYDYHLTILTGSLVPFFNNEYLHKIDDDRISEYQAARKNFGIKKGKGVSPATINRDNAVIRAVFAYAKRKKYIPTVPHVQNQSAFARRPSFSKAEIDVFMAKLDEWVSPNNRHEFQGGHVTDYRCLFRLYCLTIIYSGIRPGKEMASLRWEDLKFKENDYEGYVSLLVKTAKKKFGVHKPRPVIALPALWPYLQEVMATHLFLDEGYIFAHPKSTQLHKDFIGQPIMNFKSQWDKFIEWAGLEFEKKSPHRRRTPYSLRHYYFEQMLRTTNAGLPALADNGGTSPEVISKWYHEVRIDDYATKLSRTFEN